MTPGLKLKNSRAIWLSFCLFLASSALFFSQAAESEKRILQKTAASLLLEEGKRQLANMKSSEYQHKTQVDETKGVYNYDCSGFLGYALKRVLPEAFEVLPLSKSKRPLAQDFYAHIQAQGRNSGPGGWMKVSTPMELLAGDVIAWLKAPDSESTNTGHVMLVLANPRVNPDNREEVLIPIMDSTMSPHAEDSRSEDETGLGTGTIGLLVDQKGKALCYKWRGGVSKKAVETDIVLGRIHGK